MQKLIDGELIETDCNFDLPFNHQRYCITLVGVAAVLVNVVAVVIALVIVDLCWCYC